jgi:hypothetical protein
MPRSLRRRLGELSDDLIERWKPIADSVRLIWNAGPITMGFFLVAFAIVDVASLWLNLAVYRSLGPHELAWWFATDQPISLLIDLVVEPIRLCLIAAAYDHCLRAVRAPENAIAPAPSQTEIKDQEAR